MNYVTVDLRVLHWVSFHTKCTSQEWKTFCDFPEITDISIKRVCHEQVPQEGRVVTLTRQDDRFEVSHSQLLVFLNL